MILKKNFTIDKLIEYKDCFIDTEIPLEVNLTEQNVEKISELFGDDFYPVIANNCVGVMQGIKFIGIVEKIIDADKLWYEFNKTDKVFDILAENVKFIKGNNVVFGKNFPQIINEKNKDIIYKHTNNKNKIYYYYILLNQNMLDVNYETFLVDFLNNVNTYLIDFKDVIDLFKHFGYKIYTNGKINACSNCFTPYYIKNSLHELVTCFYQYFRLHGVDAYIVPNNCENLSLIIEKIKENI